MTRHPFDPISLVLGLVFVAAGSIVLAGGSLIDDAYLLLPAGLIGLGLALLYQIRRSA
jgi:hypothetical protein